MRAALVAFALTACSKAPPPEPAAPEPTTEASAGPSEGAGARERAAGNPVPGLSCEAELPDGASVQVRFATDQATVLHTDKRGAPPTKHVYGDLAWTWDGHLTGTAKAGGLDFTYESHYGCVRNATLRLTGDLAVGPVTIPLCQGGGTDDHLCAGE